MTAPYALHLVPSPLCSVSFNSNPVYPVAGANNFELSLTYFYSSNLFQSITKFYGSKLFSTLSPFVYHHCCCFRPENHCPLLRGLAIELLGHSYFLLPLRKSSKCLVQRDVPVNYCFCPSLEVHLSFLSASKSTYASYKWDLLQLVLYTLSFFHVQALTHKSLLSGAPLLHHYIFTYVSLHQPLCIN